MYGGMAADTVDKGVVSRGGSELSQPATTITMAITAPPTDAFPAGNTMTRASHDHGRPFRFLTNLIGL